MRVRGADRVDKKRRVIFTCHLPSRAAKNAGWLAEHVLTVSRWLLTSSSNSLARGSASHMDANVAPSYVPALALAHPSVKRLFETTPCSKSKDFTP